MKYSLIATATLAAMLAACSSTPTAPVEEKAPVTTAAPKSDIAPKPVAVASGDPFAAADALNKIPLLQKRSIYFDFDSFAIPLDYVSIIEAHSKYLKANAGAKVLIQGNTDERGSREYNLALGQKRADAVKSNLTLLGVKEAQIEAVSLGEEKPKATGQDEAAWAENRRADLVYGN